VSEHTPSLGGLWRLTDDCGILQYSRVNVPERNHGYCVDDNARALILMNRLPGDLDEERKRLATIYASFIEHAWNDTIGCFRNFMSYDRRWLEDEGSEDSYGRSFCAVATTVRNGGKLGLRQWAKTLLDRLAPHVHRLSWPRSQAFFLIGMSDVVESGEESDWAHKIMAEKACQLAALLEPRKNTDWPWFEDYLTYDNARLPEALIRAGRVLGDDGLVQQGLEALRWQSTAF
jgi:hypothetical protein